MLGYRLLGKRIVFTAHNVNAGKRDANDSLANRLSLRVQYRLADHIFVHTEKMKREMSADFGVPESKITVIPFGINQTLPTSALTVAEAKQLLGVSPNQKTLLFFGHIAPYKGLDCLIAAMAQLARADSQYRLIIAGRPKGYDAYWASMQQMIAGGNLEDKVIQRITFIPDDGVELYFKAADVLVLPYTHIFQSGVLLLGYNFGLPVVATDVGSLREDIIEGKTGFLCRAQDPQDLARAIEAYFASDLFRQLDEHRGKIQAYAKERYSWDAVGAITTRVYRQLLAP
jgi:glycosyltransferase involved in cell wall biosynthesis